MTLQKINLRAGVNKDDTSLSNEGGWSDADKARFVRGQPQTIGGWDTLTADTFSGLARGAHAWIDVAGNRYAAWGTASKLYLLAGGAVLDISPVLDQGVLTDPFTTTNGSPSVSVAHTSHSLATGGSVTFSNQSTSVGGLTLNGTYTVTVVDPNTYTITAGSNASSTATGGGNVDYSYAFPAGLTDGTGVPGGYGSGAYGAGGYGGTVTSAAAQPRIWHLDNFGESLLAVPRGGPLFEFQPALSYPELVSNGTFGSSAGWTTGTGWSIGAGVATAAAGAASDLSLPVPFIEGAVYVATFTVTRSAGLLTFKTNGAALSGGASAAISVSGTYTRLFRASVGSTGIVFNKDNAFVGTLDNVSIKLATTAYRVKEAPASNEAMFVDPNGIVVLLGTSIYLGDFSQLAVRWSDIQDVTAWTPATDNVAGDILLSLGGRIMSGLVSRGQNLIWTDTALYTMTYTGDASEPFVFRAVGTGCGLLAPLAKAENNGVSFWLSKNNVFTFGGSVPQPVPCPVRRDLFENLTEGQQEKAFAGVVSGFNEVWFFYPDSRDGSECSRYVALQFEEGHWTCGTFDRTAWINAGVFESPLAFSSDGRVYIHERGNTAAGGALNSFVEASYFDIGDGETLTHLRRIVPDLEGQLGAVSFDIYYKAWPSAAEVFKGSYTASPTTEKIDLRVTGRQLKFRLVGSTAPSFYRLGALRLDLMPTGQLR